MLIYQASLHLLSPINVAAMNTHRKFGRKHWLAWLICLIAIICGPGASAQSVDRRLFEKRLEQPDLETGRPRHELVAPLRATCTSQTCPLPSGMRVKQFS